MRQFIRYVLFYSCFIIIDLVKSDTFNVRIVTNQYVNAVDERFLSFTVDPKYLFSSNEKYRSKECICMATSLTPAYIRIAGPSTSHMTFHNTSILINDIQSEEDKESPKRINLMELFNDRLQKHGHLKVKSNLKEKEHEETIEVLDSGETKVNEVKSNLEVNLKQWKKFVQWAKLTGFDLVFALNNNEKTVSDIWDPNTALNILTEADKANIEHIYWQLGYECVNQSIEEYLNDLETLRVITETYSPGQMGSWKVVGGDVSHCLEADSKSDFKDYVTLSTDMLDAVALNGNSSSKELMRMSERDRIKLLQHLSHSSTPLWLTEPISRQYGELERAVDWMASLGFAARNGFSVHFRELMEEELYEPTMSYYMALLFKNLVGERVLDVKMDASQAILFAHCTSLRHKPVPGAITMYGVNMDEEPARLSLKLSQKEKGGDILQFVLGYDFNGNILVNGRAMSNEGDIKPVVKRVRPYKTLLINLPPKSFGFWVLANTNIVACQNITKKENRYESINVDNENDEDQLNNEIKKKRSIRKTDKNTEDYPDTSYEMLNFHSLNDIEPKNKIKLKNRIDILNKNVKNIQKQMFESMPNTNDNYLDDEKRLKREAINNEDNNERKRFYPRILKLKMQAKNKLLEKNVFHNYKNLNKSRSILNLLKNSNPFSKYTHIGKIARNRRSIMYPMKTSKLKNSDEENTILDKTTSDTEIEKDSSEDIKLGKILRNIYNKLNEISLDVDDKETFDNSIEQETTDYDAQHISKKSSMSQSSDQGLIKSAAYKILSVLEDLNKNFNRFWNTFTILE